MTILAQRGVRQLTSKEREYYEKVIEAMKAKDPKQALNDVEVVMPETIINSVFDELSTNHPLLSRLSATTVTGLTRMMMNTNGEQRAAWGKLTAKIIEELTSGFKEVDVTQDKLSAFLPVSKAMLDLGLRGWTITCARCSMRRWPMAWSMELSMVPERMNRSEWCAR